MIRSVVAHFERRAEAKAITRLTATGEALLAVWAPLRDDDDASLRRRFDALRSSDGAVVARELAVVCAAEAVRRRLGIVVRRGQLLAALHMTRGEVVELATGEGKTLAIVMAAIACANGGARVHVLTQNGYLAARDARLARKVAAFFGLSLGVVRRGTKAEEKYAAYRKDITYASADIVVFDSMRDARAARGAIPLIPAFEVAIVDEIDSILVDAASLPLVLGRGERSSPFAAALSRVVARLEPDLHFDVDARAGTALFTEHGYDALVSALREMGLLEGSLFDEAASAVLAAAQAALEARAVFHADEHYIIDARRRVVPLDRTTGRANARRRFGEGMQAAIEAKEGVAIGGGASTGDTMTYGVFVANYRDFAGATGTLSGLDAEFEVNFGKVIVRIPSDAPRVRIDEPDRYFETDATRLAGVVAEVARAHAVGQPVLVATTTENAAEVVARMLEAGGMWPRRLTAKNPRDEAAVIADAARLGAITVATQVAGRGTDIILGGRAPTEEETARVVEVGGLLVIGVEHQHAGRIDAQLRGRSGRRGDRGRTVFFVSLEDALVRHYAPDAMRAKASEAFARARDTEIRKVCRALFDYVTSRSEDAGARTRRLRAAYDARRIREERTVAALRNRLRRIAASPLDEARVERLARAPLRRRVEHLVTRNVALGVQALPPDSPPRAPLGVRPHRLRNTIATALGVELAALPSYASLDELIDALTDTLRAALEDRLAFVLSVAGRARAPEALAAVRRGQPWRPLLVFGNAYLDALDTRFRAHVELTRDEERTLGLTAMAERSPERVLELRGHERFQALLVEVGEVALAALLAGREESDSGAP